MVEPMPIHTKGATCDAERAQGPTARGGEKGRFPPPSLIIILKTVKLKVKYVSLQHNDCGLLICHQSRETIPYLELPWKILLSLPDPQALHARHLLPRNLSAGYDCSPRKTVLMFVCAFVGVVFVQEPPPAAPDCVPVWRIELEGWKDAPGLSPPMR